MPESLALQSRASESSCRGDVLRCKSLSLLTPRAQRSHIATQCSILWSILFPIRRHILCTEVDSPVHPVVCRLCNAKGTQYHCMVYTSQTWFEPTHHNPLRGECDTLRAPLQHFWLITIPTEASVSFAQHLIIPRVHGSVAHARTDIQGSRASNLPTSGCCDRRTLRQWAPPSADSWPLPVKCIRKF